MSMGRLARRVLRALTALSLSIALLAGGVPAAAVSYEDYADRVGRAHDVASSSTTLVESQAEAEAVAQEVSRLIPGTESVQVGGREIVVDNSVARGLAAKLAAADTPEERRQTAEALAEHLGSLRQTVGESSEGPLREDPAALEELLTGAEQEPSWLEDLIRRAVEWFSSLFEGWNYEPTPGGRLIVQVVLWAIAGALALLLVWLVFRAVRARRGREQRAPDPDIPEPVIAAAEGLPDDPLVFAHDLASRGAYRDAIRALFGGAARELVRLGLVRQTRTLTNGELLRAVRRTGATVHPPLSSLASDFEVSWYGHVDPGQAGFSRAVERYRDVLNAARVLGAPPGGEGR